MRIRGRAVSALRPMLGKRVEVIALPAEAETLFPDPSRASAFSAAQTKQKPRSRCATNGFFSFRCGGLLVVHFRDSGRVPN
jgi:hypothetical protein